LAAWPFYRAAINNGVIFVSILVFQHTVGLFIAVQLNAKPRFMELYRAVLFMPVIISLVSTGFIWTLMLSSNIGFINPVLKDLGLGFLAKAWLSDPQTALPTVIAVTAWNSLGWSIVIYLAGLQDVPRDLYEAAEIDGAGALQNVSFTPLAMPGLSGPGSIAVIIGIASTVQKGEHAVLDHLLVAVGIAITAVISYLVLRAATRLNQYLGATGMNAIARIMGFLLVCIGVQFVINGVLDIVAATRGTA
jgi:ABC-type sugar transport system permease subunit